MAINPEGRFFSRAFSFRKKKNFLIGAPFGSVCEWPNNFVEERICGFIGWLRWRSTRMVARLSSFVR